MRIALFSDIHANMPALEAFFGDLEKRKADAVYCLGDLVGYNIWPNEVVNEIRRRGIPTICGNYDFGVGRNSDDCGCAYKTDEEKANGAVSIAFTNKMVKPGERAYLRTLPAHIRLEFQGEPGKINVLLVHGSPRRVNEYIFEDREEKSLLRIIEGANADILCFGHTHKPFHRVIRSETDGRDHHAINIGSLGKPKDGDPRGCYVLLTVDEAGSIDVEFIRFQYDVEKAAQAIEHSSLPRAFAAALRQAR